MRGERIMRLRETTWRITVGGLLYGVPIGYAASVTGQPLLFIVGGSLCGALGLLVMTDWGRPANQRATADGSGQSAERGNRS